MVLNDNEIGSFKTFKSLQLGGDMGEFDKGPELIKFSSHVCAGLPNSSQQRHLPPKHHRCRWEYRSARYVSVQGRIGRD